MGKPRKKLNSVKLKQLGLKVREDIWRGWKIRAMDENTTMSELVEKVMSDYLKKKEIKS